nr:MAG TPA: hypothetical protein [Caudoviricetes sp.]
MREVGWTHWVDCRKSDDTTNNKEFLKKSLA